MDNQTYEQEIDLKDLMFVVLHRWRGIILAAIIFAVLLGGYKLASASFSTGSEVTVEEQQNDYADEMKLYESTRALYEQDIERLKMSIESLEEYYKNSLLMHISPYNMTVASADVFVVKDEAAVQEGAAGISFSLSDRADAVLKAYETVAKQAEGIQTVGGEPADPRYVQELIKTDVDYESNLLTITVFGENADNAEEVLAAVLKNVEAGETEIQDALGSHTRYVVRRDPAIITDTELASARQDFSSSITNLQNSLTEKETALEELEPPAEGTAAPASGLRDGIKYGILGAVLGAFVAVFGICVVFLMSDKLHSAKDIKNRFGLKILAVFSKPARKGVLSGIDSWLDRMEGNMMRRPADVYELMAVNVKNYMEAGREILVIGSVSGEKLEEVAAELRKRIPGADILAGHDMGSSVETLKMLPEAGQIVLVEEREQSKCEDIQSQLEIIRSLDKTVVGCVVL